MNNTFNYKHPEFQSKYGKDWDAFLTIINDAYDYFISKIWGLYRYRDVNTTPENALEVFLKARGISYDSSDTFLTKKIKFRKYLTKYRDKGLDLLYLDIQEGIVGTRGNITSGQSLGVWRWGYSRWHDATIQKDDMRWALAGSQFEIYIDCLTTDATQLDQITFLYRDKSLLPAFYQIYLVDSNYTILRTI